MIGFEILALAAAQAASPPNVEAPSTTVRRVPLGRLVIPDEIAPAVVPYMGCLYASGGIPVYSNGVREQPVVAEGTDCTPQRERAVRNADRMLRDQGRGTRAERLAYVEAVLGRIEAFVVAADPARNPDQPVAGGAEDKPDAED